MILLFAKTILFHIFLGGYFMSMDNKKLLIIGDRDGIPGQAIEACVEGKPVEILFSSTECFV